MIGKLLTNLTNLRSTALGFATLLVTAGTAVTAFVDGDSTTVADWPSVTVAATSFIASLWLIFGSKD